ncbi:MAG: isochorismate synthase [Leptolyngbya sp.]|nr:isochorismate synthase [Leptolyngbya sp.]
MPVASYCLPSRQDLQAAQPFINECLARAAQGQGPLLASLSFAIPPLDPLLALSPLAHRQGYHLYLERPAEQEAVVAFGSAVFGQFSGRDRFAATQRFIKTWQQSLHCYQDPSLAGLSLAPRFFCNFSFFPQPPQGELDFPAAMVVLPQWQVLRRGDRHGLTVNLMVTAETTLASVLKTLEERLDIVRALPYSYPNPNATPRFLGVGELTTWPDAQASHHFQDAVAQALRHLDRQVQKIVLAHAFDLVRESPFQVLPSLAKLRQRYPDCYLFAVGNGRGTTFMGASPERLLSITQGQLLTDALAGSAPRGRSAQEDRQLALQLLHSPKEQGEHQLVVKFLHQQLRGLGLRPQSPSRPTLLRLSNIQHLHTPIQARVSGQIHPLHLVEALHPTPAVAGVPTAAACDHIHRYERFDRGLYAAPLGWVEARGDSEFIVGIRSALINGNWARLYAGAGIVAGSDPAREWAEITLKSRALGESLV